MLQTAIYTHYKFSSRRKSLSLSIPVYAHRLMFTKYIRRNHDVVGGSWLAGPARAQGRALAASQPPPTILNIVYIVCVHQPTGIDWDRWG